MSKLSEILQIFAPNQGLGIGRHNSNIVRPKSLKLNFRGIKIIDRLPQHLLDLYCDVEELSLNHNELRNLDGIDQFRNLRLLRLQSNLIEDMYLELSKIANKERIEEIWIDGNGTTGRQSNHHLLNSICGLFPRLAALDGKEIDQRAQRNEEDAQEDRNNEDRPCDSSSSNSSSLSPDWKRGQQLAIERQGKSPYTPISDNLKHMRTKSPSSSPSRKSGHSTNSKNQRSKYQRQIFGMQSVANSNQVKRDQQQQPYERISNISNISPTLSPGGSPGRNDQEIDRRMEAFNAGQHLKQIEEAIDMEGSDDNGLDMEQSQPFAPSHLLHPQTQMQVDQSQIYLQDPSGQSPQHPQHFQVHQQVMPNHGAILHQPIQNQQRQLLQHQQQQQTHPLHPTTFSPSSVPAGEDPFDSTLQAQLRHQQYLQEKNMLEEKLEMMNQKYWRLERGSAGRTDSIDGIEGGRQSEIVDDGRSDHNRALRDSVGADSAHQAYQSNRSGKSSRHSKQSSVSNGKRLRKNFTKHLPQSSQSSSVGPSRLMHPGFEEPINQSDQVNESEQFEQTNQFDGPFSINIPTHQQQPGALYENQEDQFHQLQHASRFSQQFPSQAHFKDGSGQVANSRDQVVPDQSSGEHRFYQDLQRYPEDHNHQEQQQQIMDPSMPRSSHPSMHRSGRTNQSHDLQPELNQQQQFQQIFYHNQEAQVNDEPEASYGQVQDLSYQQPYHDSSTFQASQVLATQGPEMMQPQVLYPRTIDPTMSFPPPSQQMMSSYQMDHQFREQQPVDAYHPIEESPRSSPSRHVPDLTSAKLSTIEELVARSQGLMASSAEGEHRLHTLEPMERLEMFVSKRRLKMMLSIFYQWKSIARMRLNSVYQDSGASQHRQDDHRRDRNQIPVGQNQQQPVGILLNKKMEATGSHPLQQSLAYPSYFTFNQQDALKRKKPAQSLGNNESALNRPLVLNPAVCQPALSRLIHLLQRQHMYCRKYAMTQWYRCSLYQKMRELEMQRDQYAMNQQYQEADAQQNNQFTLMELGNTNEQVQLFDLEPESIEQSYSRHQQSYTNNNGSFRESGHTSQIGDIHASMMNIINSQPMSCMTATPSHQPNNPPSLPPTSPGMPPLQAGAASQSHQGPPPPVPPPLVPLPLASHSPDSKARRSHSTLRESIERSVQKMSERYEWLEGKTRAERGRGGGYATEVEEPALARLGGQVRRKEKKVMFKLEDEGAARIKGQVQNIKQKERQKHERSRSLSSNQSRSYSPLRTQLKQEKGFTHLRVKNTKPLRQAQAYCQLRRGLSKNERDGSCSSDTVSALKHSSSLSELNYQRVDRYKGSLKSLNDQKSNSDVDLMASETMDQRSNQLKPKVAYENSKQHKSGSKHGAVNLEVKNLLIHKNRTLLSGILHAWHVYALKQFKRRMEKKKAKKLQKLQKAKEEQAQLAKTKDKHSASHRLVPKSQRNKASSAVGVKTVNIGNKLKSNREAGLAALGALGSLLQHTESLRELVAIQGERKLKKQASQQRIEHQGSLNLEKLPVAKSKTKHHVPSQSSRSASRVQHHHDSESRPGTRSGSSQGVRHAAVDSHLNSNRNSNGDKKSQLEYQGASSSHQHSQVLGDTRSINIQIKNKQFKDVSPLRKVLAVQDDSKAKEKASLRLNFGQGAAPPKSPSMLQKYSKLQSKFKQLNNSFAKIQKPLEGNSFYEGQALSQKARKKKAGSELRSHHQTSRSHQKKDLNSPYTMLPTNASTTHNILDTSSVKSSQKHWNLPHNKYAYPHQPSASQMQPYSTLVRLNSKKSLKSSVPSSHRATGTQSNSAIAKVHSTLRNVPQHGIIIENVRRI